MNCIELLAEPSRCQRGIPVARLFRHYFCESDHKRCPIKSMEKMEKGRVANRPSSLLKSKEGL
jgi:uncharacterized protein YlaI